MRAALSGAIAARNDTLSRLRAVAESFLSLYAVPVRTMAEVELALSEAAANICEHAYRGRDGGPIWYAFRVEDRSLTIELQDRGVPFRNRKPVADPDWAKLIEAEADGGFGRFAMQKTMDQLRYSRRAGRNVLVMTKRLRHAGGSS